MNILRLSYCGRLSFGSKARVRPSRRSAAPKTPWQIFIAGFTAEHGVQAAASLILALGLSNVSNLQKSLESPQRARRGSKGATAAARLKVRSAADWLQDSHGRRMLSFLTLTIPSQCLNPRLLDGWSELSRKLRQWLSYHLEENGVPAQLVGVVEIQEERQVEQGLACLHWHLVFVGKKAGRAWAVNKTEIKEYWNKLLSEHSGVQTRGHAATRIENVNKSASGYLGKYMSKCQKAIQHCNPDHLPSAWYMISRSLLRKINSLTIKIEGQTAEQLYDFYQENQEVFRFSRFVEVALPDGATYCIGWLAELKNRLIFHQVRRDLIGLCEPVKKA